MNIFQFRGVGQGLFYTGSLCDGKYNFCYDCGTESKLCYLNYEVRDFSSFYSYDNKLDIDFIVISHLHKDHFSGLPTILKHCNVKTIYLPYLGEDNSVIYTSLALAIYGEENEEDAGDGNYELFSLMCGLYGLDEDNNFRRYREVVRFINNSENFGENQDATVIYRTDGFIVKIDNKNYWQFNLIQSRISDEKLIKLNSVIENTLGAVSSSDILDNIRKDKGYIDKIKAVYEVVFGKGKYLNLTSIVLLHFPIYRGCNDLYILSYCRNLKHCCFKYNCFKHTKLDIKLKSMNTVLTGDAMIDEVISYEIKDILNNHINVLQVPHHGAKENWQELVNNSVVGVVNIIPFGYGNNYGHPSVDCINYMEEHDIGYFTVTQGTHLFIVSYSYCYYACSYILD